MTTTEEDSASAPSEVMPSARPVSGALASAGPRYRLIAELGHGGMGVVYLAVARGPAGFSKLQVLKRLQPSLARDPESVEMFLDEARLAARLNHPNVVQTNEVGNDGDHYFLAMEYLDGQALEMLGRRAKKSGGVPLAIYVRILADALCGLHHAHELKDFDGTPLEVVHRDVSPHNIFVTYDGIVKVVDFGIAKAANRQRHTESGVVRGKSAYLSPEQVKSEAVDRRSDIFAVGVMLWQALTGERLWRGLTDLTIFHKLANESVPTPRSVRLDIDARLEAVCMRALASDPSARYATAADMQAALEAWLRDQGGAPTARDIGQFVRDLFADSRNELRAVIEGELASGVERTSELSVPSLDHLMRRSLEIELAKAADADDGSGKSAARAMAMTPGKTRHLRARLPSHRRSALLGVALAAGIVVAIGFASSRFRSSAQATSPGQPPAVTSGVLAAPHAAAAAGSARGDSTGWSVLSIRATPVTAAIWLDDARVDGNPFSLRLPRDGTPHIVRVEASGYAKQSQSVVLDGALHAIDVVLNKIDFAPAAGGSGTGVPTASATGGAPAKPRLGLDTDDPWR